MVKIIYRAKRKRITKQIRVDSYIHQKLLKKAVEDNRTIAKTVEKICLWYFNNELK
ncbi:MAG: hypothetical protein K9L98_02050 [Candidatus Pacebacteria bacterium]|nr:hypothetical protein [Candidatus Paceibacterota bacterium]MCF7862769.1 hypothetical protein [Candidatus Paceibacterota bacterium]